MAAKTRVNVIVHTDRTVRHRRTHRPLAHHESQQSYTWFASTPLGIQQVTTTPFTDRDDATLIELARCVMHTTPLP